MHSSEGPPVGAIDHEWQRLLGGEGHFTAFWLAVRRDDKNRGVNFNDLQLKLNAVEHLPNDMDTFILTADPSVSTAEIRQRIKKLITYQKMTNDFGIVFDDAILDNLIETRRPKPK